MFAIIKTSGSQYKVTKNSVIKVNKICGFPGESVEFNEVLMIGDYSRPSLIGTPLVRGASVTATILEHDRDNKIIVFKKKRRQNYRRKHGHKQQITKLKIVEILI